MDITELLTFAHRSGASDVHLSAQEPPRVRIHGDMKRLEHPPLSANEVHDMLFDIMSDALRRAFQESNDVDFSFELGDIARFRVNVFRGRRGEGAVFRTIPTKVMTIDDLGLPAILKEICDKEKGLVLVTGPTGSGKTTTLYSCLRRINTIDSKLLTAEDPVEFDIEGIMQVAINEAVGMTFMKALRAFLRQDPDIIMLGEMRDLETSQIAIQASLTGHLVLMLTPQRVMDQATSWWQAVLNNDAAARAKFTGTSCAFCGKTGDYAFGQKGI